MQNAEQIERRTSGQRVTEGPVPPKWDLEDRFSSYAVRVLRLSAALPKTEEALHIRRQILRSGTSAGANYHEARGAESTSDFVHKLQVVLKELRETQFWIRIITSLGFTRNGQLSPITAETDELIAITVKSLKTARSRAKS